MKYPCGSLINQKPRTERLDQKKCGYFDDDKNSVVTAFSKMGLKSYATGAFQRHPLAFLVEAADDISNAIVDSKYTVDQRLIRASKAIELLTPLANRVAAYADKESYKSEDDELERLRAYATNCLANECATAFHKNLGDIFNGLFGKSLIDTTTVATEYEAIRRAVEEEAFTHPSVLEIEVAGFEVINGLLSFFVPALTRSSGCRSKAGQETVWPFSGRLPSPAGRSAAKQACRMSRSCD